MFAGEQMFERSIRPYFTDLNIPTIVISVILFVTAFVVQSSKPGELAVKFSSKTPSTVHVRNSYEQVPPAWPKRNISHLCTEIFIKIKKCGSSTNGGVARAIAAHRNLSGVGDHEVQGEFCVRGRRGEHHDGCRVHANHGYASLFKACRLERGVILANGSWISEKNQDLLQEGDFSKTTRVRPFSLLWTTVREPRARALSHYYQHNVKPRVESEPTDKKIIKWISQEVPGSYMYDYMDGISSTGDTCESLRFQGDELKGYSDRWKNRPQDWDRQFVECKVNHLLDSYDFVGVVERQDESLVAMKMLFDLQLRDVLYMSAKVRKESGKLIADPSPELTSFLDEVFLSKAYVDAVLHEAANAKLDATIAQYGADYDREFERYTTLSVSARDFCGIPESVNEYHKNKTENSSQIACYWRDNGCGYECLDQFAAQHEEYGD